MIERFVSKLRVDQEYGICRASVVDDWVFVSATAGTNWETGEISEDVVVQTHQMIDNLTRVLQEVRSGWPDVVKRAVYLADARDTDVVYRIIGERTAHLTRPASQGFETKFLVPRIKVEMTLVARRGAGNS